MDNRRAKILMVSQLYPPFVVGGYELRCSLVAKALQERGYKICVVTSSFGRGNPRNDPEFVDGVKVFRCLHDYYFTHISRTPFHKIRRLHQQYADVLNFLRIAEDFAPDIVNWWYLGGLCKGILSYPTHRGIADVHWIEDVWMNSLLTDDLGDSLGWDRFWRGRWGPKRLWPLFSWPAKIFQRFAMTRSITFCFENLESDYACFSCEFQRAANAKMRIQFKTSSVIYGGSKVTQFYCQRDWRPLLSRQNPIRLLYIAAITENRKLDILLNALEGMEESQRKKFLLTVIGKSPAKKHEAYYEILKESVRNGFLRETVDFLGKIPYDELPNIYATHDILIFTSARPEGIPNAMLEAMLSGLCVLSTGVGGAGEIAIVAEQPLFLLNNSDHLCEMLLRLEMNRPWLVECAQRNQKVATERFSFNRMVDQFEEVLQKLFLTR